MSNDAVFFEKSDRSEYIWTLILKNPKKRNSLTPFMLSEILKFLKENESKKNIRVLVVRGEGEIAFSAGYDISQLNSSAESNTQEESAKILYSTLKAIEDFSVPVIGMINGVCIGAGCHLAVCLDLRIACEEAKIGITPAKIGILYHPDGIRDFINLIGIAKTKELFYTGKLYSANEAKNIGLIDYVVPSDELEDTVYSLAKQIALNAPLSVQGTKYIVNKWSHSITMRHEVLEQIMQLRQEAYLSKDYKEGRKAFSERRKPIFRGQ